MNGEAPLVLVVENMSAANLLCVVPDTRKGIALTWRRWSGRADKARLLNPVAITLDILLPHVDGWNYCAVESRRNHPRIPVVIVSVVDDEQLGYALGAGRLFRQTGWNASFGCDCALR